MTPLATAEPVSSAARLTLAGYLPEPQTLDLAAVRRLPRQALGPTRVNCYSGRPVAEVESYAGARLIDLLDAAGFSSMPRSECKRCVVIAGGADGYRAMFSWSELYNSTLGDGALVLYERDGRPLDEHIGPLSLISAHDTQLGPRHLRRLESIVVMQL